MSQVGAKPEAFLELVGHAALVDVQGLAAERAGLVEALGLRVADDQDRRAEQG